MFARLTMCVGPPKQEVKILSKGFFSNEKTEGIFWFEKELRKKKLIFYFNIKQKPKFSENQHCTHFYYQI